MCVGGGGGRGDQMTIVACESGREDRLLVSHSFFLSKFFSQHNHSCSFIILRGHVKRKEERGGNRRRRRRRRRREGGGEREKVEEEERGGKGREKEEGKRRRSRRKR